MYFPRIGALFCISALLLSPTSYCAENEKNPFTIHPFAAPEAKANQYQRYRERWSRLTGFEYSGLHWNDFIVIFTQKGEEVFRHNYLMYLAQIEADEEEEEEEVDIQFKTYPSGTIILKENYASHMGKPSRPLTLTIMIKRDPGYDPEHGDWEYLQTNRDGVTILNGNSQNHIVNKVCANCHINVAERDYIFSTFYSSNQPLSQ